MWAEARGDDSVSLTMQLNENFGVRMIGRGRLQSLGVSCGCLFIEGVVRDR